MAVAPGIPEMKISELPTVKKPEVWEFSAHPHAALRAGQHIDMRLGNPKTGIAHSFVLPKSKVPKPGEMVQVIPTLDHTVPYMDFVGDLPPGYGQGRVTKGRRTKAEVYHADPSDEAGTKLRFNLYDEASPEEFSLRKDSKGKFFLHNKTQTRARRPDLPATKPAYREIQVEDVNWADLDQILMPKLDGAHALIDLKAGRSPRVYSYREAKRAPTGLIEHTHKMPGLLERKVPKSLDGTVLRAELVGVREPSGSIGFPSEEHSSLRSRLDGGQSVYTTRVGSERGGYQKGTLLDSPLGPLEVEEVRSLAAGAHPFKSELTAPQRKELAGREADLVKLKRAPLAVPAQLTGGLLNSGVWKSRAAQEELGVRLKAFPFSVVRHKGRDMENAPFSEKLKVLREAERSLRDVEVPEIAEYPEDKANLIASIAGGSHPLTEEGVVAVDKTQPRYTKAKFTPDFDVYVRKVHPAVSGKTGEPHNRAGAISYSWTPDGPIVGQLGGFKHTEAKDMLKNPDRYIGRAAKVKAMKVFTDKDGTPGTLFQPRFKEWHLDKGDIEKESAVMNESFLDELQHITKEALSRAAKELILGRLSPGALERVRGVLTAARPPEVMAGGLARGSANIAQQLGVPVREGTLRGAAKRGLELLKRHRAGGRVTAEEGVEAAAPLVASMGGGGLTVPIGHPFLERGIYLHEGQPLIRAMGAGGRLKGLRELAGLGMNPGERRYLSEIIKRHEIDEARAMASGKSFMQRRGGTWTPSWREKKVPFMKEPLLRGGGSHADPRVLMEESRNLAFAPQRVRQTMRNIRSTLGEAQGLKERAGVSLGERTPLAGSRQAREAERSLSQVPQVNLVTAQGPMHMSPEFIQEAGGKVKAVRGLQQAKGLSEMKPHIKTLLGR